jgi:peptidoglycan hydrolase-like protein with peptidoglycan-binding domain
MRPLSISLIGVAVLGAFVMSGCTATVVSGYTDPEALAASTTLPLAAEVAPVTVPTSSIPETDEESPQLSDQDGGAESDSEDQSDSEDPAVEQIDLAMTEPLVAVGTNSGAETARLQERLLQMGFWVSAVDGRYGLTTRQGVMAVQKYVGLPATGAFDAETATVLSDMSQRARGRADAGTLVEVDKTRQLMFLVVDGQATWTINVSTGTEIPYERPNSNDPEIIERGTSITPTGLYRVNRERPEGWWAGDLGEIYRPKYFVGGVAVHGANSVPNYPASSGCVRVSVPAMDWIWENDLIPMRSPIWVHGEIPSVD